MILAVLRDFVEPFWKILKWVVICVAALFAFGFVLVMFQAIVLEIFPNLDGETVRAKRSRARGDQRAIATALESYKVDHGDYPIAVPFTQEGPPPEITTFWQGILPDSLTTPVAYLRSLYADPFAGTSDTHATFAYFVFPEHEGSPFWIIYSQGPDEDYDIRSADSPTDPDGTFREDLLQNNTCDPTNCTRSNGDIAYVGLDRFKPQ
ncbi:type II secretion system protein GspG [bacterium]|nr:type II secretion system protein GspG [bacterium]